MNKTFVIAGITIVIVSSYLAFHFGKYEGLKLSNVIQQSSIVAELTISARLQDEIEKKNYLRAKELLSYSFESNLSRYSDLEKLEQDFTFINIIIPATPLFKDGLTLVKARNEKEIDKLRLRAMGKTSMKENHK